MSSLVLAAPLRRRDGLVRLRARRAVGSRLVGPASIIAASASLQAGAALAAGLFATFGAASTSALRFAAGAVVLLALARPRLRRSRRSWVEIGAFGAATAGANLCLFEAIARVSLGTAVTLQFLGPLALALLAARRRLDLACAVVAAAGVALLTGGPTGVSVSGTVFGLGAAACVALSIVVGERVARHSAGLDGLALAVGVAALLTLPVGVAGTLGGLDGGDLATVAALGVLGIAVPYALFLNALRHVGAKTYSVLLSLDPAVAMLAGLAVLAQSPGLADIAGIVLVVVASATAVGTRPEP